MQYINKIIIFLLLSAVFISHPVFAATELPNQTLKIILNQPDPKNISVQSIFIEQNNPEHYMLQHSQNYYTMQIIDQATNTLFTGQIGFEHIIILDPAKDIPDSKGQIIEYEKDTLDLNLPYFAEAKRVKIYDEQNNLLLDINLALYGIGSSNRYGECDQCGYCKGGKVPQKWDACRACLYPAASTDPIQGDTLLIDPISGEPVKPAFGQFYSDLGCISSPLGFMSAQGPAAFVRSIMSIMYTLTGAIALVMLMYGAFLVVTSKGSASSLRYGKQIIMRTIVGVVIVFTVVFMITLFGNILRIPGFGSW